MYYEEKDRVTEKLKSLKPLPGSKMIFYKNGVSQGQAFTDVYGGAYFPSLSIHKGATVSLNFGPNFKFSPTDVKFRSVSIGFSTNTSPTLISTYNLITL